jgi:hypothetical protein
MEGANQPEMNDPIEIDNNDGIQTEVLDVSHTNANDASEAEMVHQQDTGNAGFSSAPLTQFSLFTMLPPELRRMIVEEATPPATVDVLCDGPAENLRPHTLAVGQVNRETRTNLRKTTVTFKAITLAGGPIVTIRMDPVRDTYLTHDLKFPWAMNPQNRLEPINNFRNVVSTFSRPLMQHFSPFDRATTDDAPVRAMDLGPFPDIREYTMLAETLGFDFWIPDVTVPYEKGEIPLAPFSMWNRDGDYDIEPPTSGPRIRGDTGLEWIGFHDDEFDTDFSAFSLARREYEV